MDRVDVALATYKGARFLPEFLQSVGNQSHADLRVVASDDSSPDDTRDILTAFQPDRTVVLVNTGPRGFCGNFGNAIAHTDAPYVALADQDDVWVPGKIETLLAHMKALEGRVGADKPIIVCSDLAVVDQQLKPLRPSFLARWKENIGALTFADLTLGNRVPGCSMLLNRALVERAMPLPSTIVFHDWWFMLVASAFGAIEVLDEPLILYRQHGGNQVGDMHQKVRGWARISNKLASPLGHFRTRAALFRTAVSDPIATLEAFRERFCRELPAREARLLDAATRPGLFRKLLRFRGARSPFGRVYKLNMLFFMNEAERKAVRQWSSGASAEAGSGQ